eukprot:UN27720
MQNLAETRCLQNELNNCDKNNDGPMKRCLRSFINEMWNTDKNSITPIKLLNAMVKYNPHLKGRRQQDSYECFQSITRGLESESQKQKEKEKRKKIKFVVAKNIQSWTVLDVLEWIDFNKISIKKYQDLVNSGAIEGITGKKLNELCLLTNKEAAPQVETMFLMCGYKTKKSLKKLAEIWANLKKGTDGYYLNKIKGEGT